MKNLLLALTLAVVLAAPAHAFSLRKVLGVPGYIIGFSVCLILDVVTSPLQQGFMKYMDGAPLPGW